MESLSSKKRILFVSFGRWETVGALRATNLAVELNKLNWDARLIVAGDRSTSQDRDVTDAKLPVFEVPSDWRRNLAGVRKVISDFKPEYIHFLNTSVKTFAIVFWLRGTKVIVDWEDWCQLRDRRGVTGLLRHLLDRWFLRRSEIRLTCSRWLSEHLALRYKLQSFYLPYACHPDPNPILDNPFAEPTAVFMGSLWRARDHRLLLEAMRLLKESGDVPRLQMIGGGEDYDYCKAFIAEHSIKNIELVGFLPEIEMRNSLAWAHVLVFPITETVMNLARCPFKAFLYAQAGRPIITSSVGEVKAVLGDRARYEPPSAKHYAIAIRELMNAERLPNIDYEMERQSWRNRAVELDRILRLGGSYDRKLRLAQPTAADSESYAD